VPCERTDKSVNSSNYTCEGRRSIILALSDAETVYFTFFRKTINTSSEFLLMRIFNLRNMRVAYVTVSVCHNPVFY